MPPRRATMEVQLEWLENPPELAADAGAPRKKPPRLPGASRTLPPMPVPRHTEPPPRASGTTIEVEPSWLEILEERRRSNKTAAAASAAPAEAAPEKKRSVRPPAASVPPASSTTPRTKRKPIPRED